MGRFREADHASPIVRLPVAGLRKPSPSLPTCLSVCRPRLPIACRRLALGIRLLLALGVLLLGVWLLLARGIW